MNKVMLINGVSYQKLNDGDYYVHLAEHPGNSRNAIYVNSNSKSVSIPFLGTLDLVELDIVIEALISAKELLNV